MYRGAVRIIYCAFAALQLFSSDCIFSEQNYGPMYVAMFGLNLLNIFCDAQITLNVFTTNCIWERRNFVQPSGF